MVLRYVPSIDYKFNFFMLFPASTASLDPVPAPPATDFCEGESFEQSCAADEVIFIHSALYGRMRLGTCISFEGADVGCSVDVRDILDTKCSGIS